jgi:hypothetical protein
VIISLAALAAASPSHVSDLKYATTTFTPGALVLGAVILAVLILAWRKLPGGPVIGRRRPARAKAVTRPGAGARR